MGQGLVLLAEFKLLNSGAQETGARLRSAIFHPNNEAFLQGI